MPEISVIIPVYKSEKYLEKCFDSILKQTFDDFEIIVVNDGSPDSSQQIIDRYKEQYPEKIKAFVQENKGQAAARNFGLQYAEGEYISFVDSDDYIETNAYKTAYTYAKDNDIDIVCFGMYEVNDGERHAIDYRFVRNEEPKISYLLNETSPCNKLIKRSIFSENGLKFTENRIYEDLELIPQLALYTDKIGFVEDGHGFGGGKSEIGLEDDFEVEDLVVPDRRGIVFVSLAAFGVYPMERFDHLAVGEGQTLDGTVEIHLDLCRHGGRRNAGIDAECVG